MLPIQYGSAKGQPPDYTMKSGFWQMIDWEGQGQDSRGASLNQERLQDGTQLVGQALRFVLG